MADESLGEPVSRSATQPNTVEAVVPLYTLTVLVKAASSSAIAPSTRPGPCSGSEDVSAWEATASTSRLWSNGAWEKMVEIPYGGPKQARAESRRRVIGVGLIS